MKWIFIILLSFLGTASANDYTSDNKKIVVKKNRYGGRFYIKNTLLDIFGPETSSYIDKYFFKAGRQVGGPCDIYEQVFNEPEKLLDENVECITGKKGVTFPHFASNNILRTANLVKTCYELIYSLPHSKKLNELFSSKKTNKELVEEVSKWFYPYGESSSLIESLTSKYEKLPKNRELYKKILLTYCLSPEWQEL